LEAGLFQRRLKGPQRKGFGKGLGGTFSFTNQEFLLGCYLPTILKNLAN